MSYTPHNYNQTVSNASVIEVTDNDKVVTKDIYPKVVYFTAKWCGPCQRITPVYKSLAKSNPGIKFFKVDVDNNDELTSTFGVQSMPTFFFFKSKNDYKSFTGADEGKLKTHVNWLA
jgi:thioredoxin 1